jgi:tricorn protease
LKWPLRTKNVRGSLSTGYYRTPDVNGSTIVFVCESDLWSVEAESGIARRLTASSAPCLLPRFSPDGQTIAYVGPDEGHPEVYVLPASGGPLKRITFLGSDGLYVCSWSSDGASIYFTSDAAPPFAQETFAYSIHRDGGEPRRMPLGHVQSFGVNAQGRTVICRNNFDPARWKRYRGGRAGQLWLEGCGQTGFARIGEDIAGNVVWPMWHGDRIAFLSDHDGIANIYSITTDGQYLPQITHEREYYCRFPATDGSQECHAP